MEGNEHWASVGAGGGTGCGRGNGTLVAGKQCCEVRLQKWMGQAMDGLIACVKGFGLVIVDLEHQEIDHAYLFLCDGILFSI